MYFKMFPFATVQLSKQFKYKMDFHLLKFLGIWGL